MKTKKYLKSIQIKRVNGGKENDYRKDYIKIKFNSDDDLPLNQPLKLHLVTIIIRSVFKEDGKFMHNFFQTTLCMSQCKHAAVQKN